jgi:hypothetical protein
VNSHPQSSDPPIPQIPGRGFSADLQKLEEALLQSDLKTNLGTLDDLLKERGFITLVLILSLPFIQPIPVPGLSILFGLAIFMLGLRIALGRHAGLPQSLRRKELETATLVKMIETARKIFAKIERLFRRRLSLLVVQPGQALAGVALMANGVALALPLPPVILFSNGLPAMSVFLICLGLLERDGLLVLLGHVFAIITWLYFGLWADLIIETLVNIPTWFGKFIPAACQALGVDFPFCSG